jgi:hypothetical protein
MTTVAELAQLPAQTIGYLFVVEGLSTAWTDTLDLAGRGFGYWIGSDDQPAGERPDTVVLGLEVPESVETGTDLEENMLREAGLTVSLIDRTGELIGLIAEPESRDYMYERLSPLDDPAPAQVIGQGGDNVDVWSRIVNGENIGPAGQRGRFPVIPGSDLPGRDHAAYQGTDQGLPPSTITDAPDLFQGNRRCALYVIRRDITSAATGFQAWPNWTEQFESGVSLIWWGTIDTVKNSGLQFKLSCKGPESWLRRTLGLTMPAQWQPIESGINLSAEQGQREDLIAMGFSYYHYSDPTLSKRCGFTIFDPVDDVISSNQDASGLRDEINARIQTIISTAGPDETFDTYRNGVVNFNLNGLTIRVDDNASPRGGLLALCMHRKVWSFLGYDVIAQARVPMTLIETEQDIYFQSATEKFAPYTDGDEAPVPGPDYYIAYFYTVPIGFNTFTAGANIDNGGGWRTYRPLNDHGGVQLDPDGQQEIPVSFAAGTPYSTGQLARPVADYVMESGDPCDRTGWMVFRGPYREDLESDPVTLHQVAKVSWVNFDNSYQPDNTGYGKIFIEKWLDPRNFGFTDKPFTKLWHPGISPDTGLECAALGVVGYNTKSVDYAHLVLLRLLLSTGTKVWDAGSYEDVDGASYTAGVNAHPDAVSPHLQGDDQDIADLGLRIPHQLVDWQSFVDAANALPDGGYKSGLNTGKLVYHGAFDAQETIAQICKPRAYFMGLDGFRYTLFSLAKPLDADDAALHIGESDLDSDAVPYIADVDFSALAGYDKVGIEYHYSPVEGAGETTRLDARPLSTRVLARAGNAEFMMEGRGLLNRALWVGDGEKPPSWESPWRKLHTVILADYYLQPHVMLTGVSVKQPKANLINPGTIVTITNPWPATREGSYGMTAKVGRVVRVRRRTDNLSVECDIFVQAGNASTARRFAPIARVLDDVDTLEERHDAATRTLYCYHDMFGAEGGSDVKYFQEPIWSDIGGDALVYGYQYDGREWSQNFSFTVETVNTSDETIIYKPGSFAGTFRERGYTILTMAPYNAQTADWVRSMFAVNTGANGKFGGTPGFELVP